MKLAIWSCVLAALLSTTARAQGAPDDGPFSSKAYWASVGVSTTGPQDTTGPRVGTEFLAGGLGAISGGLGGLLIGAAGGSAGSAGVGMLGGIAVGSTLGISLAGGAFGGRGEWGATLLGTLGGTLVALLVDVGLLSVPDSEGVMLAAMVALPVGGGVIGYEVSHSLAINGPAGPVMSIRPSFSLARDGKSSITGVAGTF